MREKITIAELKRRESTLRCALHLLLNAWPADSLPPPKVCIQVANAINNVKS